MSTITKLGQIVFKGVNWVHNDKISSYGLERSNLCTQCKNRTMGSLAHLEFSGGFHMKFTGFHRCHEIQWISCHVLKNVKKFKNS